MNIFKVFASAKKGFQEEYASAILAWLLNPAMEHGLGYAFLAEFLAEVGKAEDVPSQIGDLAASLRTHLRYDSRRLVTCATFLELYVEDAFIDVVVNIEVEGHEQNWTVAVENKIFSSSASDSRQLTREYEGLKRTDDRRFRDRRIAMVFLVPTEHGKLDPRVEYEWSDLRPRDPDFKALITWGGQGGRPSISHAITSLLDKEHSGEAQPIHDTVRHTLKAMRCFIADGFLGYPYEPEQALAGLNSRTEDRLTYPELRLKTAGWVGVPHGVGGLLRIMAEPGGLAAYTRPFQYTTKDMTSVRNWLPVNTFMAVAALDEGPGNHGVTWLDYEKVGPLPASLIYYVSSRTTAPFYVGIDGGKSALDGMAADVIDGKRWGVATKQKSEQWVEATTFRSICEGKGISWTIRAQAAQVNTTP